MNTAPLRIRFVDFWPSFRPEDNFFFNLLKEHLAVELSDDPEVVFFSCFGRENRKFPHALRFYFTGENIRPNRWNCDYSIGFDFPKDPDRECRWPLYNLYFDPAAPANRESRDRFCCMVVSNPENPLRKGFFDALSEYRQVDSGGRYLNNVGGPVPDKLEFVRKYKFCLSMENASWPGYTTEKLMEAKAAGCIPVYWGNPLIAKDFNAASFVSLHDFSSIQACVDRIAEIDQSPELYQAMVNEPLLPGGAYTPWSDRKALAAWLILRLTQGTKRARSGMLTYAQAAWDERRTALHTRKNLASLLKGHGAPP